MRVLIAGCGYVGLALGRELVRRGHHVTGVRRPGIAAAIEMQAAGVTPIGADLTLPNALSGVAPDYDVVVHCMAAGGSGVEGYKAVYINATEHLLRWLGNSCATFIYTSSTGVYGQDDGSVVTEDSPTNPAAATGRILVEAEKALLDAARGKLKPVVLRLAGIYGPGRAYWLNKVIGGGEMRGEDHSRVLNMIHRDDAVSAILKCAESPPPGPIYNVVDDRPVSIQQLRASRLWTSTGVVKAAAEVANAPGAQFASPAPPTSNAASPRPRATNKRVSNEKLKTDTGWKPLYPTFEEGFASLLKGDV